MDSLQGMKLIRKSGEHVSAEEALSITEIVCYYFSAHWCPPCRMFTPVLGQFYSELKSNGKNIEVIFVSSDRTEQDMMQYMKEEHDDWLAVPFGDPLIQKLKLKYEVRGIPCLIVVKRNGDLITIDGRSDVNKNGANSYTQWIQKV